MSSIVLLEDIFISCTPSRNKLSCDYKFMIAYRICTTTCIIIAFVIIHAYNTYLLGFKTSQFNNTVAFLRSEVAAFSPNTALLEFCLMQELTYNINY